MKALSVQFLQYTALIRSSIRRQDAGEVISDEIMKVRNFISMVMTMLRIGLIGFGGGSALIPVIEEEIVEKDKIITEEAFNDDVMIASITPGALPVHVATGIGMQTAGTTGMIAAAAAMALPGVLLTVLLQVVISSSGAGVKAQINYLAMGISAYIILTLFNYALGTVKQAKSRREGYVYGIIVLAVFVLSGEKSIYELFHLDMQPIFSLSTIQVLGAAFFVILYTKGQVKCLRRSVPAAVIALCYFLCAGNAHVIPLAAKPVILAVMLILSVLGLVQSILESPKKTVFPAKRFAVSMGSWAVFVFVLSVPAMLLTIKTFEILGLGALSSVMSFGGGDAYLSVAQGLFVEGGIISNVDFYGNVVSIANAMPGSILCKVLTGIAYNAGYNLNQSVVEGVILALSGFACSVALSGAIFEAVFCVYEKYENLQIFAVVKHFIRPIISGLLLSVAVSLYTSGIRSLTQPDWPNGSACLITVLVIAVNLGLSYLQKKGKSIHLLWKIFISAGISFAGCNLFMML